MMKRTEEYTEAVKANLAKIAKGKPEEPEEIKPIEKRWTWDGAQAATTANEKEAGKSRFTTLR